MNEEIAGRPMRAVLVIALAILPLAGCLTGTEDQPEQQTDLTSMAGPYVGSHPAFGYPTYGYGAELDDADIPDAWRPIAHKGLPDTFGVGSLRHLAHVPGLAEGNGIAVFGHYAFVGGYSITDAPMSIVDIQDPANPVVVATADVQVRDAETIAYPDGRLVVVTVNGPGIGVVDVTDPTDPEVLPILEPANGIHNIAVLPGTPLVYNSPSSGSATDIWDLSDPENPVLVQNWENGYGCHDIMWYINATEDKYRGYCAGIGATQIWDVKDPFNPVVIAEIGLPDDISPGSISHLAMVNHAADILIVGDETFGGIAPACDYYYENPVTGETDSGNSGNLWFYDLSDETDPQYMSRLSVNAFQSHAMCTSHFGRIVEDTNHMVIAFYGAGVILVDFNDLENPRIVDQWRPASASAAAPGATWDAWYYQGYVITGDILRGMDVLALDAPLVPLT